MTEIPFDLLNPIIAELEGCRPALKSCGLVCHTWLQISRPLLLRSISFDQYQIEPFLRLCDSPSETISLARVQEFSIAQNRVIDINDSSGNSGQNCLAFNRLLGWRPSEGTGRSILGVLKDVKTLSLAWIGWWSLDAEARGRLLEGVRSVKTLKLWMMGFERYDQAQALIKSFPALSSLTLTTIRPIRDSGISLEPFSSRLVHLKLHDIEDAHLIQALVPCPALRTFECDYVNFADFDHGRAEALGKLLASAGSSLEVFSFTINAAGMLDNGVALDGRFKLLNLSRNPNLRRIELWIDDSSYLIPFFERLTTVPNRVETLDIYYLQESDIDWARFDKILLHSSFSSLRELNCVVFGYFELQDVVGQPRGWYKAPNVGSQAEVKMKRDTAEFKANLPGLYSRDILRVQPKWRYVGISLLSRTVSLDFGTRFNSWETWHGDASDD
ncbi:hypothetical protein V5O48_010108 [Marasmius crinis-equi]|uniref:F-box domain-containing protein n=1 Tax=Marasmius crinis-equi TaxID=585013 RepID=A0ABR3F9D7_9AGAR